MPVLQTMLQAYFTVINLSFSCPEPWEGLSLVFMRTQLACCRSWSPSKCQGPPGVYHVHASPRTASNTSLQPLCQSSHQFVPLPWPSPSWLFPSPRFSPAFAARCALQLAPLTGPRKVVGYQFVHLFLVIRVWVVTPNLLSSQNWAQKSPFIFYSSSSPVSI